MKDNLIKNSSKSTWKNANLLAYKYNNYPSTLYFICDRFRHVSNFMRQVTDSRFEFNYFTQFIKWLNYVFMVQNFIIFLYFFIWILIYCKSLFMILYKKCNLSNFSLRFLYQVRKVFWKLNNESLRHLGTEKTIFSKFLVNLYDIFLYL